MRRLKQAHQHARLLFQRGFVAEVVARQVGKAELVIGRKLPRHLQLNRLADDLRRRQQRGWRWFFKLQQDIGRFDLNPLTAVQFHLRRGVRLRQHPTGHEFSGFFKQ